MNIKEIKKEARKRMKPYSITRGIWTIPLITIRLFFFILIFNNFESLFHNMTIGAASQWINVQNYSLTALVICLFIWMSLTLVTKASIMLSIKFKISVKEALSQLSTYGGFIYGPTLYKWYKHILIQIPTALCLFLSYATAIKQHYNLADPLYLIAIYWFFMGNMLVSHKKQLATTIALNHLYDSKQTIAESKKMTNQQYLQLWKLKLSFIFWNILNFWTLGLFSTYLYQYKTATLLVFEENL
jgi:membrane protein